MILFSERNHRALLKLLFDAAAQTLLEFGRGELGGKIGFRLVLHTWDQQLRPHFHVHGLSKMFRGKYLDGLTNLLAQRQLELPPQLIELDDPSGHRRWLRQLRRKIARLPAEKFLLRFLLHVLPDGFMRIRHYGLLANRGKRQRLDHVRRLLGTRGLDAADSPPQTAADWMRLLLGIDIDRCPACGELLHRESLRPTVSPSQPSVQVASTTDTPVRGPPARDASQPGVSR